MPSAKLPSIVVKWTSTCPLRWHAEDRSVLQLTAIDRVLGRGARRRLSRHGEAQQQADRHRVAVGVGGTPRPSSTWHDEQAWALNIGPSPSRASVDAGAVTQFWLNRLSPTSNVRRSSRERFGAGKLNEVRVELCRVVSPPRSGSSRWWRVVARNRRCDQHGESRGSRESPGPSVRRGDQISSVMPAGAAAATRASACASSASMAVSTLARPGSSSGTPSTRC